MKTSYVLSWRFFIPITVILVTLFAAVQPAFAAVPGAPRPPKPTRTPKPTSTPIASPTVRPSSTPTVTSTTTATATATFTPTVTFTASATFTVTATATFTPTATLPSATVPRFMTALGDSITGAYDTGGFGYHREYSWSTGTSTLVNSIYLRFKTIDPSISAPANLAISGTKMAELNAQAISVSTDADFITILMGANDVCTNSLSTMTSVDDFTTQFTTAMDTLASQVPNAEIHVASIPDIYRLWELMHDNANARFMWSIGNICQSMLANPLSTAQVDIDRRAAVAARNLELNDVLKSVCGSYPKCHFDNYAVYNTQFQAADVSTIDYFHPAISGQAKLADVAWNAWELP